MLEERTAPKQWAPMLRISKSHLQTYLICPRKFWFQYVVGQLWEFVPPSLPFGSALHAAVAFFNRTLKQHAARPDPLAVTQEFEAAWENEIAGRKVAFEGTASKETFSGLGKALLAEFVEHVFPRTIEAVEYPFSVPLYDPDHGSILAFTLVGIIDLVESDDEGNMIISELKTSS